MVNPTDIQASRPQGTRADVTRPRAHELAVRRIEAKEIANALRPFGILNRETLRAAAGAARWHEGSFTEALESAVLLGLIDEYPLGFYRYHSDPAETGTATQPASQGHASDGPP